MSGSSDVPTKVKDFHRLPYPCREKTNRNQKGEEGDNGARNLIFLRVEISAFLKLADELDVNCF
jgi:hypothetical protein